MNLHGHLFSDVCDASGRRNILPVGYPFHKALRFIPGYTNNGVEFVAKTVTIQRRVGNMPLKEDGLTPRELRPKCIYIDWQKQLVLNAVSLSNFGLEFYLAKGVWQNQTEPFRISFMPVSPTHRGRLTECEAFADTMSLVENLPSFKTMVVIQLNVSCPNTHIGLTWPVGEIIEYLKIISVLNVPIEVKFGPTFPPEAVVEISKSLFCSCVNGINSVPFGTFADYIDWNLLFGRKDRPLQSPLIRRGFDLPGGLSGPRIKPVALNWINKVKTLGCHKPIIGGGGITEPDDVDEFAFAGADGISLGVIGILAPWNMKSVIERAEKVFRAKEIQEYNRTMFFTGNRAVV